MKLNFICSMRCTLYLAKTFFEMSKNVLRQVFNLIIFKENSYCLLIKIFNENYIYCKHILIVFERE